MRIPLAPSLLVLCSFRALCFLGCSFGGAGVGRLFRLFLMPAWAVVLTGNFGGGILWRSRGTVSYVDLSSPSNDRQPQ